tara:strand:- start:1 stop:411 length:411 start_codon:yes stop_codon:yes gene_type:complete
MAKKHANKKPKKKGKVIKMAKENPKQEEHQLKPEEAMQKLVDQFKSADVETRGNILFNMNVRMGQALDGLNARLDMLAGVIYKMPEVQKILADMKAEQEAKKAEAAAESNNNKEKEANNGQSEPELSKEGVASESE